MMTKDDVSAWRQIARADDPEALRAHMREYHDEIIGAALAELSGELDEDDDLTADDRLAILAAAERRLCAEASRATERILARHTH